MKLSLALGLFAVYRFSPTLLFLLLWGGVLRELPGTKSQ